MLQKNQFPYRADIDGLRAIAVLLVMLCHASVPHFSGGFIGVDVFFVISGFVVTTVLAMDIEAGQFRFSSFYAKRAKRLVPSLLLVVVSTLIFTALFNIPERLYDLVKNACYVFFFLSNLYQAKNVGYFATEAEQIPLLHIWSLSIEEQFYLCLPLVLAFLLIKRFRVLIGLGIVVFAGSLAWSLHLLRLDPSSGYYSFLGRIFEFIPGVALALYERRQGQVRRAWWADVVLLLALLAILLAAVGFDKQVAFPGFSALLPVLASVLLIFASRRARFLNRALLEQAVFVHFGKLSYCLYLWHWPVLYFCRYFQFNGWKLVLCAFAASYMAALFTHKLVEQPLRLKAMPWKRAIGIFLASPAAVCTMFLILAKHTDELSFVYPDGMTKLYQVSKANVWDEPRAAQCWGQPGVTDAEACVLGRQGAAKKGFLWGDSHAYHLIYFVDKLGKDQEMSVQDAAYSMCPPLMKQADQQGDPALREHDKACAQRNKQVMQYLLEHREIGTVFMSGAWAAYNNTSSNLPSGHGFVRNEFGDKLEQTVAVLVNAGKQVVLFNDIPYMPKELINCNLYNSLYVSGNRECSFPIERSESGYEQYMPILESIRDKYQQVSIIDTYHAFCQNGRCQLSWAGMPIYKNGDYGHLNLYGSHALYQMYLRRLPLKAAAGMRTAQVVPGMPRGKL
ncbi:hypothetical protein CEK28_13260 [Xenophilus sp. AP218F]|nr:hypothetical protein CEK28_13260 [Xenophilus sp. AP218F]